MKQARYSEQSLGHFGLAARAYTHFELPGADYVGWPWRGLRPGGHRHALR
jgi:hypothetical protein